jgi:polyisoprenoid-binding protein YceI
MTAKRRKWPWFLGGGVLLIVIAAIAGPFIYIHFIQADPPPKLTFENIDANAGTTTTAAAASGATTADPPTTAAASGADPSGSIDGTWNVASGSQAGYRVKEVLLGQNTDAVGRTSSVTGSLTISGTSVSAGSFTVDLTTVKSDESQRDSQFQGRIMNTAQFPTATFTITKPIDLGSLPADKTEVTYTATGDLNLHGVTKSVDAALTARRNGANIEVSGTIPVKFSDYQINNPSTAAVTTQDNGVVEFLLVFSQS